MNTGKYSKNEMIKSMENLGFDACCIKRAAGVFDVYGSTEAFASFVEDIDRRVRFADIRASIDAFAKEKETEKRELYLAVLCAALPIMTGRYRKSGCPENVIHDTFGDLVIKSHECMQVYGVCGIDPFEWYGLFSEEKLYRLGRLEFEKKNLAVCAEYDTGEVIIREGDTAVGIHIPSGIPLRPEDVDISLAMAYDFFADRRIDGKLILQCGSWLLYPGYERVFGEKSNITAFRKKFDMVGKQESERFGEAWRVFGTTETDPEKLPTDTRLRAAFAAYMKDPTEGYGAGKGVIVQKTGLYR